MNLLLLAIVGVVAASYGSVPVSVAQNPPLLVQQPVWGVPYYGRRHHRHWSSESSSSGSSSTTSSSESDSESHSHEHGKTCKCKSVAVPCKDSLGHKCGKVREEKLYHKSRSCNRNLLRCRGAPSRITWMVTDRYETLGLGYGDVAAMLKCSKEGSIGVDAISQEPAVVKKVVCISGPLVDRLAAFSLKSAQVSKQIIANNPDFSTTDAPENPLTAEKMDEELKELAKNFFDEHSTLTGRKFLIAGETVASATEPLVLGENTTLVKEDTNSRVNNDKDHGKFKRSAEEEETSVEEDEISADDNDDSESQIIEGGDHTLEDDVDDYEETDKDEDTMEDDEDDDTTFDDDDDEDVFDDNTDNEDTNDDDFKDVDRESAEDDEFPDDEDDEEVDDEVFTKDKKNVINDESDPEVVEPIEDEEDGDEPVQVKKFDSALDKMIKKSEPSVSPHVA